MLLDEHVAGHDMFSPFEGTAIFHDEHGAVIVLWDLDWSIDEMTELLEKIH
jgi:hypothetical protein